MKEALLYEKLQDRRVHCFLCAHQCRIMEGNFGTCGVRQNIDGTLFTHAYAKPVAMHVDPIEKKPLYHYLPGSTSFSIATFGCNFRCGFCQNWQISQVRDKQAQDNESRQILPREVVDMALREKCSSISYTYTEPTIFFEYAYETAMPAKEKGLKNIFVTNGFMTAECLRLIKPYLDAANVDLKFFNERSYREICGAQLTPVLDSIKLMKQLGIWIEITTLIIPGLNDSDGELKDIAGFIAGVDNNIPWHVSRFHPDYQFNEGYSATEESTLKKAFLIGKEAGLKYIYAGNVRGFGNDTLCHGCGRPIIKREIFDILEYNIMQGKCSFCKTAIPGKFLH